MNTIQASERRTVIEWLKAHKYPALPVAPSQDPFKYPKRNKQGEIEYEKDGVTPKPLFTGKNPSYLNQSGVPHLVNHRQYQNRLPSDYELEEWFANLNGVGTLGGWHNTSWLDFDVKQFPSQEECDAAVLKILENSDLQQTFIERSHSGGWRIGVRVKKKPGFTNFALSPGGKHVGEALGIGRFTVLAPTVGTSGNAYQSINRAVPVEVESLESIGIYPTSTKTHRQTLATPRSVGSYIPGYIPGSIPLEQLGTDTSREILGGKYPTGDRSEALATALQEWYGWQNWTRENDIAVTGTPEDLANYAGQQMGIDTDRVDRIIKTIDIIASNPAALHRGDEESCWKKVRRLNKEAFEVQCPTHIKDRIKSEWNQSNISKKADSNYNGGNKSKQMPLREAIVKAEEILKSQISSQLDSIEANILLEELRREVGVNEYNWERKYLKPIREKLERSLALPDANETVSPIDPYEAKRLELKAIASERDPLKLTDKLVEFCCRTKWSRRDVEQQIRLLKTSTITPKAKRLKGKDFLGLETESISWVFPGIIPSRGVFVIGGHAGTGKTTFAYDAVGSLLLREEFLGEKPVRTGKVLIVTGDELPCFTQDKLIDRGIPLENEDWEIILNWDVSQWEVLEEAIADIRPSLVVIDSFSSIHRDPSFDENSSQAKSTIYDLEALTNTYGCGCILIHHLSKSKENQGVAKLRGSSAISAAASVVCLMEEMSDGNRKLSFPKVRGAQTAPFVVELDGSSGRYEVISGGDDGGTKSLGDRVLAFLSMEPHKRYEQSEISEALGIPYSQKDSVYQALGRLFKRGLITKRPSRLGGRRKVYGISNPYSYSDNSGCDTLLSNVTDTLNNNIQDTPPPSPLKLSVQKAEPTGMWGVEVTDNLTDNLTDTKLTPHNDVQVVSPSNPTTVGDSAKLTDIEEKGRECVPSDVSVQTVTPQKLSAKTEESTPDPTPEAPQPQKLDAPACQQINAEMKRLGWSREQGRDYLIETYGKRSRQLLSDAELLDFLHRIKQMPAPEFDEEF